MGNCIPGYQALKPWRHAPCAIGCFRDWSYYEALHSVISYDFFTPEEVEQLLKKAYLSFYLQPKQIVINGRYVAKFLFYLYKM